MAKRSDEQWFTVWTGALFLGIFLLAGPADARADQPHAAALKERVPEIKGLVDDQYAHLEALYKYLHTHPELSLQEEHTAARLAQEPMAIGFEVTPGAGAHGLV